MVKPKRTFFNLISVVILMVISSLYENIILIILLGSLYVFYCYKRKNNEAFTLNGANYPCSVDHPLLYGFYPVKKNPSLSNENYSNSNKTNQFLATSTTTNNIKYWNLPENGTCTPIELCGGLYNKLNLRSFTNNKNDKSPSKPWSYRINYYNY